jgi:serine/threonine-protein kinase PRP4
MDNPERQVAIKILRTNYEVMRISGDKERQVVSQLNQTDPHDKKNVIRLYESFDYNNHLCLVYECMDLNLREVLNKHGRGIGLSLDGVCLYGRQLFTALAHLLGTVLCTLI